jgi:hypothetical protein
MRVAVSEPPEAASEPRLEGAVTYIVQFKRLRRGIPEVIRTMYLQAVDGAAALAHAKGLTGTRRWPARTDALRVMDDGGRTLIDWAVPAGLQHDSSVPPAIDKPQAHEQVCPPVAPASEGHQPKLNGASHQFAVGQPVSRAGDDRPDTWEGGYKIVRLAASRKEPQYAIRSADEAQDRAVPEHEFREDLGARLRGQQAAGAFASNTGTAATDLHHDDQQALT